MSESKEECDLRHGRHVMNAAVFGIEAEELANACRHLGIAGPLEPLLRELKIKDTGHTSNKETPRKVQHKREKRVPSRTRESPDCMTDNFVDYNLQQKGSKNSYGQESWGRDSGARDLSPEPQRMREDLNADAAGQLMDCEAGDGGTSAMLNLASKVSVRLFDRLHSGRNFDLWQLATRTELNYTHKTTTQIFDWILLGDSVHSFN